MINETKAEKLVLVNNGSPIVGRNAAGTADIEIARVNASDEVEIAAGSAAIKLSGSPISWTGSNSHDFTVHAQNAGDVEIHAQTGKLSLETTTGTIEIGATNHSRTITFATGGGAAQQVVTIGSPASSSSLTLDAGTGAINMGASNSARTINVGTGTAAQIVNIATGAAAHTVAIGSTTAGTALTLNAGSTGQINATARTNVKAAAGLYVTEATGANGVSIFQQSGTTHTLGSTGTTTTLRVLPTLEMDDNITILTDKAFSIGAIDKRFNTITCQTTQEKTHDAFAGSAHVTATSAVQTTNSTTTTLYTSPALLDESGTWVEVHVSAHDTGGSNRGMAVRRALITRDGGGSASVVGSVNDSYSNLPGAWGGGVALTAVNIDTTGNTFRVRVQGTSATINWSCSVRYQSVSQNT